jgi:ComF family protein
LLYVRPPARDDIPGVVEARAAVSYRQDKWFVRMITGLKAEPDPAVAWGLARKIGADMAEVYEEVRTTWLCDFVLPVPSDAQRLAERGYNPAELLGLEVARRIRLPIYPAALIKVKVTAHQRGQDRAARLTNLDGAFRALMNMKGRRVLVVDDVLTTGATLAACASALHNVGVGAVYGLTGAAVGGGRRRKRKL